MTSQHGTNQDGADHEREALEQELLELHFGCHENPDLLEARLRDEPELQKLYAEVQGQASIMKTAACDPIGDLELPTQQAKAPLKALRMRPRLLRLAIAAAAALVLFAPFYLSWAWNKSARDAIADTLVQVSLASGQATPDGSPVAFTVSTTNHDRDISSCDIQWRALDAEGQALATGKATTGTASPTRINLPAALQAIRRIEVTADTPRGPKQVALKIGPTLATPLVHLTTSKPIYRPGETVRLRTVALDRLELTAVKLERHPKITIIDPRESEAGKLDLIHLGAGSYAANWEISGQIAEGRYLLQVTQQGQGEPLAEQAIVIRRFQAPRLAKQIDLDRTSYAADSQGTAEVQVTRLAGGAAAGAKVEATLIIDGEACWNGEATLSAIGSARFEFDIPSEIAKGAARFVAKITDGGTIETIVEPFIVPTGEIKAIVFPEGGDLVTGLSSQVYIEVRDLLDRPVSAEGRVVDQDGKTVTEFTTEHQGRGRFALTPAEGARYAVVVDKPSSLRVEVPSAHSTGVVLHAEPEQVLGSLALTVQSKTKGPFTVAAFCRGALVGQSQITGKGTHSLSLPIDKAQGVLRVTVFDAAMQAHAERLVQVKQDRKIDLALAVAHEQVAPGDEQKITLTARDEQGNPIDNCVIGLNVSDAAVWARSGEPRIGLANTLDLFGDVHPLDDLSAYLPANQHSARNADLLLATQAWRRFAWQPTQNDTESTLARAGALEGYNKTVVSTMSKREASETLQTANAVMWSSWRREGQATNILVLLAVLFLLIESLLFGGRVIHRWTQWREGPILSGIAGAGVLGMTALLVSAPRAFDTGFAAAEKMMPTASVASLSSTSPFGTNTADGMFFDDFEDEDFLAHSENLYDTTLEEPPEEESEDPVLVDREVASIPEATELELLEQREPSSISGLVAVADREFAYFFNGKQVNGNDRELSYWHPFLITDARGETEASFHVTDRVTTWIAHADAYGNGRIGQKELRFDAKLPFYLEAKLPTEVTEGDELSIPIALVSETNDDTAQIQIRTSGGAELTSPKRVKTELVEGRGRVLANITIKASDKPTLIHVQGRVGANKDRRSSTIRVVPSGFPHHRSWAGKTKPDGTTFILALPEDQKPRNTRATLKLFPSPLASLRESLEGIVQEPHGCFEQASSSNYPNLLVLDYLQTSGDNIPALANRARAMLPKGYDLITSYECKSHGYEWFGSDPGHETLTAYGLLQFTDMQRVADVDAEMITTTRDWLLARRDGKGGFGNSHSGLDTFGGSPEVVNNAYITYALLYSGTKAEDLKPELDALEARATTTEDPYELALIASALREAGQEDNAAQARRRLAGMQLADGSVPGATTSITSSGGANLIVESTSFAILAWLGDDEYTARILLAVEYLQTQQSTSGTFGAAQATIMALKALTAFAGDHSAIPEAGTLHIIVDGDVVISKQYESDVSGAITVDFSRYLSLGQHEVTVQIQGVENPLPWACSLDYFADMPADDGDAEIHIITSLSTNEAREGDPVTVITEIKNTSDKGQGMTMAIIGLPAGLEVPTKVLEDLKRANDFAFWELRGREVILYWRDMAPKSKRTITLDAIARIPGTTTGPASRAYLYYTPDLIDWAHPLRITIK